MSENFICVLFLLYKILKLDKELHSHCSGEQVIFNFAFVRYRNIVTGEMHESKQECYRIMFNNMKYESK